jgi:hypothetical protein
MRPWGKMALAFAAPLALSGCLWGPGKFTSDLSLRKNGTFSLAYQGEIVLQMPDDKGPAPEPWDAGMASCHVDGSTSLDGDAKSGGMHSIDDSTDRVEEPAERPCTPVELAKLKSRYETESAEKLEKRRLESQNVAKLMGLPGTDDESNRRFAEKMGRFHGWRSVRYVGKGVFDVDYQADGRVDQDFAFPIMPDSDFIVPFITIRRRNDGTVMVSAPAYTGGTGPFSARARMLGLPDKGEGPPSRAQGRFTITSDGEILTNNSEDGPQSVPGGRAVRWDVGPGSTKVPEMLVRL